MGSKFVAGADIFILSIRASCRYRVCLGLFPTWINARPCLSEGLHVNVCINRRKMCRKNIFAMLKTNFYLCGSYLNITILDINLNYYFYEECVCSQNQPRFFLAHIGESITFYLAVVIFIQLLCFNNVCMSTILRFSLYIICPKEQRYNIQIIVNVLEKRQK